MRSLVRRIIIRHNAFVIRFHAPLNFSSGNSRSKLLEGHCRSKAMTVSERRASGTTSGLFVKNAASFVKFLELEVRFLGALFPRLAPQITRIRLLRMPPPKRQVEIETERC